MNLTELGNLSAEQIKSDRDALVEAAKTADPGELAGRCVQWLLDAKMRDERLAEQGTAIRSLERTLDLMNAGVREAGIELDNLRRQLCEANEQLAAAGKTHSQTMDALRAQTQRADRLRKEAIRNADAINSAANQLNLAIAARQIEQANNGE